MPNEFYAAVARVYIVGVLQLAAIMAAGAAAVYIGFRAARFVAIYSRLRTMRLNWKPELGAVILYRGTVVEVVAVHDFGHYDAAGDPEYIVVGKPPKQEVRR